MTHSHAYPALLLAVAFTLASALSAQNTATPIGHTSARDLQVSGAVDLHNGEMQLGNGSTVTAGDQPVSITLNRGGQLRLCSTTSLHLSHDRSIDAPDSTALMLGLDRGAIEANYTVSKYSDVLLTPDLRVLISGPGKADLRIRVNSKGDTCIDNRGPNAPYVTITSQLEGGLYRVQPNQHVTFEHGSLREVVDTETEPCGCPPSAATTAVASAATPASHPSQSGQPVGGPSSTPADTAFPLALSEGLTAPPLEPTTPVAAPGEVHAQVIVPLSFNGNGAASGPPPAAPAISGANPATATVSNTAAVAGAAKTSLTPAAQPARPLPPGTLTRTSTAPLPATHMPTPSAPSQPSTPKRFFSKVGNFFSRIFGAEQS